MSLKPVTFVHLSDIHFQRRTNADVYDLDADLRSQLERDVARMKEQLQGIDGILVSGDIAFSGQPTQFTEVHRWLSSLCDQVGCQAEDLWVVPGNHDLDRTVIKGSPMLQDVHSNLREQDPRFVGEQILSRLEDPLAGDKLLFPLKNYNDFAAKWKCTTTAKSLYWEHDIFLNDDSILRLRGMNSTLVSNPKDNDSSHKLILGISQATAQEHDGVEYLTLCHHPPQWLRDQDEVESWLNSRVRIQLFGHKHSQKVLQINESVRIHAGATHPDNREPNWKPRYNVLSVWVERQNSQRKLCLDVYPRIWNNVEKQFMAEYTADGSPKLPFALPIRDWEPAKVSRGAKLNDQAAGSERADVKAQAHGPLEESVEERQPRMNRARRLTYRFLSLPYHKRLRIATEQGLIEDEDRDVPDLELPARYFERAKKRNVLEKLWDVVEQAHGTPAASENPYKGK